jgi:carbon storage regulator
MLVLTRRVGEKIVIGNDVVLQVVEVRGDRVRLGFDAPPAVVIDRLEVHERKNATMPGPADGGRPDD